MAACFTRTSARRGRRTWKGRRSRDRWTKTWGCSHAILARLHGSRHRFLTYRPTPPVHGFKIHGDPGHSAVWIAALAQPKTSCESMRTMAEFSAILPIDVESAHPCAVLTATAACMAEGWMERAGDRVAGEFGRLQQTGRRFGTASAARIAVGRRRRFRCVFSVVGSMSG